MASKWLLNVGLCLIVSEAFASFRILHKHFKKSPAQYEYETLYFTQQIDHFSFTSSQTYQQRYLVSKKWWQDGGPIFFYTGNEGAIDWFANNTGFMWDIAPEFSAMLVFAEHRYYGKSMPFGKDSFKDAAHVGYLTSEQAMADFAKLILYMKANTPGAQDSPVIAFGGSYGGMLAAWFRIKYPHIVKGALAASAPIWWFGDLTPCGAYYKKVTDDFVRESKTCAGNIRASWDVINQYATTASGLKELQKALKLCSPLKKTDVPTLKNWLTETWGNLAMVDYPYPASFLEPLPAWPIKEVCKHLSRPHLQGADLLASLTAGLGVYYNSTGSAQCYNISVQDSGDMGDMGWNYQACTEMVMPMCSDGVNDMFEPAAWNLTQYIDGCKTTYNMVPRPSWVQTQYGGKLINDASNIIFSNGRLDPWSGGGVMDSISDTLVAIVIDEGAHHLDLRSSNPRDPQSVLEARQQEKTFISNWIKSKPMTIDVSVVQPGDVWIEPFSQHDEWQMRLMMGLGILLGISLLLLLLRANTHRHANQKHKAVLDNHMKKPLLL